MKYIYTLLTLCIFTISLSAQDTLLWQNFENDIPNMIDFLDDYQLGENIWINWDRDEIDDANSRAGNWDFYLDYSQQELDSIPPADTNTVFGSSSWLAGFAPGNENWLITPPIIVADDQAILNWKSAPFQGPRYMDGYSVMVSTTDFFWDSFTDTLFRHSQMIEPLPAGNGDNNQNALNVDSFNFAPLTFTDLDGITQDAYIHDNRYTGAYTTQDTTNTFFTALLEPHTASLAKFSGETIYIAFVHDSDDDNLISVDDILVTGTLAVINNEEFAFDVRYALYPNPATHAVNLSYRFGEKVDAADLKVYDITGRLVASQTRLNTASGDYTERLDVSQLIDGQYTVVLTVDGQQATKSFVKN